MKSTGPPVPPATVAFLLSQLGAHSAKVFAEMLGAVDLRPPEAGLLRLIAATPGQSQQAVAAVLGTPPSRLVHMVDELERRGLVERRRNPNDRRHHALHLSADGERLLEQVAAIAAEHDDRLCAGLSAAERDQLRALLSRAAERQGLTSGVHPGYRALRGT